MPVSTIERPINALRQRMLEDMAMRGLRSDTQHGYIRFLRVGGTASSVAVGGRQSVLLPNRRHVLPNFDRSWQTDHLVWGRMRRGQ